ncbi:hypothetical protein TDSAC_1591 [Thermodesulfobium acidiphilum]|uniref:Uncharacterized protein n=1 Tax=Thermodesulfobium acidiphilum TaxID=1794699 RepID=A0A2R4W286_THEAF|nr:hypothetical protein [Thermodesulfobium acidiphilum]AWB10927.1 hypothetical protein TDSAC_1591 [Thermodesulfobium acidiphilum]PMP84751.1 MAG: hypothetical protein C0174_06400 [Thermodesulfobium narugense]
MFYQIVDSSSQIGNYISATELLSSLLKIYYGEQNGILAFDPELFMEENNFSVQDSIYLQNCNVYSADDLSHAIARTSKVLTFKVIYKLLREIEKNSA